MLTPQLYFLFNIIFYAALSLSSDNKVVIILFGLYLFILLLFTKKLKEALFYTYIASWPIVVGKTYVVELVTAQALNLPFYTYGIANYITISAQEILLALMVFILLRDFLIFKKNVLIIDFFSTSLFIYISSLFTASVLGSIRPDISLIHSIYSVKPLIFYWYVKNLKLNNKVLPIIIAIIASSVLFESTITILQFARQTPLGITIETSQDFLPIDTSLEAAQSFRPVGTFGHANGLAHYLLPYLWIFLPFLFLRSKYFNNLLPIISLIAFGAFLLTLSRSAWLSFFCLSFLFLFIVEKRWHFRLKLKRLLFPIFIMTLPAFLLFTGIYMIPRISDTIYSFNMYGAGYARAELLKDAWETISKHPWFGVGIGMDIFYSYQQSLYKLNAVISYFPEAVHNGFIQLLAQTGIPSFLLYITICIYTIRIVLVSIRKGKPIKYNILLFSNVMAIISLFINALFQPFTPNLQDIAFLSMIYLNHNLESFV